MTPRILITGGTGFVGVPCVHAAVANWAEVHVIARSRIDGIPGVRIHPVDLFDTFAVAAAVARIRPTHLLHLAWETTPVEYWSSPINRRWIEASLGLLRAFSECGGQRVAVAGTSAEYDWTDPAPYHETASPIRPATVYGQCKEKLLTQAMSWAAATGVSLAWLRLFSLYGRREHPDRLVPSITRAVLAGAPAVCRDSRQIRDYLYVDDAAAAIVAILLGNIAGPINVASGEPIAVRNLARAVAAVAGRPDLLRMEAKTSPAVEPTSVVADVCRLRDEVGWRPRVALIEGMVRTVSWWRDRRVAA